MSKYAVELKEESESIKWADYVEAIKLHKPHLFKDAKRILEHFNDNAVTSRSVELSVMVAEIERDLIEVANAMAIIRTLPASSAQQLLQAFINPVRRLSDRISEANQCAYSHIREENEKMSKPLTNSKGAV